MLNFPIIDAHIHVWDINHLDYQWLEQFPKLNRTFLLSDYNTAIGNANIEKFIYVQCECHPSQYLEEIKWIERIAKNDQRLAAIIPWAPIHSGKAVINTLESFHSNQKIKGVRQIIQNQAEMDFCLKPQFIEGIKLLGEYNLHFELTISPEQFPSVIKMVEQCPETRFILDHVGNPNILNNEIRPWKDHIKAFSETGNHYCKFSNFVCNADLNNWNIDDLKPYSDHIIETFGPDRLIWGSDWPHALRASSWSKWFDTAIVLTEGLSKEVLKKIFYDNAKTFYNL
jgi:L-fuconolactonase